MDDAAQKIPSLERQIASLETRLAQLRSELKRTIIAKKISDSNEASSSPDLSRAIQGGLPEPWRDEIVDVLQSPSDSYVEEHDDDVNQNEWKYPLRKEEYKRYGRQLIMPEVGLQGQLKLKKSKVLVVGVGGLGCPAAAYLTGAGVGTLGLVDDDVVEESNLHRQILHSSETLGMSKVDSAIENLRRLNPMVNLIPHLMRLNAHDALDVFRQYDLILDCTDTPASRYLISDVCVALGKPFVSGSALKTDGQLMVLNNPPRPPGMPGGPCYRCIFPKPPPVESVVTCGEGGILGPVVGVIGVLQALGAIKIITAGLSQDTEMRDVDTLPESLKDSSLPQPSLLLFSAYSSPQFREVRLRSRRNGCIACSREAWINEAAILLGLLDYAQFCGTVSPVNELSPSQRTSAINLAKALDSKSMDPSETPILIDTRDQTQFDLCHLDNSYNIPFSNFTSQDSGSILPKNIESMLVNNPQRSVCVVCRLGNDSQIAAKKLQMLGFDKEGKRWVGDLKGGLKAWREEVDSDFPDY